MPTADTRPIAFPVPADLREATCCLTLLAGAGTRWVKTLAAAKAAGAKGQEVDRFPLEAPRGLFPVRNFINDKTPRIPLAAYAVDAFRGLGRQLLVVRGWEEEIRSEILEALDIGSGEVGFCTQELGPGGKALGHGDAARQARPFWRDSTYVLTNFGGDANSPLTARASLNALASLNAAGEDVGLLLPVAEAENPAYPVILDAEGIPRAFGHNKLGGAGQAGWGGAIVSANLAYTNVGIRAYRTEALLAAIHEIESKYWREDSGYSIPGNDPESHEFALDNVDALLASRGKARILAIAKPEELTPAKSFDEIGRFEAAAEKVRAAWRHFVSAGDSQ
ncbi:MAG: hypothetical protein CVV53_02320 [Spirochaetae bacterium HGW-Spirochaetae-9]|nr:MAG: hypothetical protein CVV53_02320 [Spirochaetae bacterium HGW-Spirochaetae-9]